MKKTALIGLAIAAATQANAATLDFAPPATPTDYNWDTLGNWQDGGSAATAIPGAGDTVRVDDNSDATRLLINTTAQADALHMGKTGDGSIWMRAHVEIQSGAQLTLSGGNVEFGSTSHRRVGYLTNYGTLNAAQIGKTANGGWELDNHGTINLTGNLDMQASRAVTVDNNGDITLADLKIGARTNSNAAPTFNMNGGSVTGTTLASSGYGGILNLSDGTMTFDSVTFFDQQTDPDPDDQWTPVGLSTINVTGGSLTIVGQNVEAYFENAIDQGWLTGVDDSQVNFIGGDTVIAVPEPSTYALLAGCFGLTWVMLRRRR